MKRSKGEWIRYRDQGIAVLLFIGIFLIPVHLRTLLFQDIPGYYRGINFPGMLAVLICCTAFRKWKKAEWLCAVLWMLMAVPVIVSEPDAGKRTLSICQNLLPLFLVLYRMDEENRQKAVRFALLLFDIFMILFFLLGIEEFFNGRRFLIFIRDFLQTRGYDPAELTRYIADGRVASIWGHPLTTALLFNLFFSVNLAYGYYYVKNWQRYVLPLFTVSFLGVLMASSKTGFAVCILLLLAAFWKQKKYYVLAVPVILILYFSGALNGLIRRFETTSLTTGRMENLLRYFEMGTNRIMWFTGNGSNALYSSNPDFYVRAGFEFPEIMFAYDFGIVFSIVTMGGLFLYCACRFLARRQWLAFSCYVLLFAQISTYNGYSLRNQDICLLFNGYTMMMLNMASGRQKNTDIKEEDAAETRKRRNPDNKKEQGRERAWLQKKGRLFLST